MLLHKMQHQHDSPKTPLRWPTVVTCDMSATHKYLYLRAAMSTAPIMGQMIHFKAVWLLHGVQADEQSITVKKCVYMEPKVSLQ